MTAAVIAAPEWLLEQVRRGPEPASSVATGQPVGEPSAAIVLAPVATLDVREQAYLRSAYEGELQRLDGMAHAATTTGAGYAGPPWDTTCFQVAANLVEIANAGLVDVGTAWQTFAARAPRDKGFTLVDHRRIWESAFHKIGAARRSIPAAPAADFPWEPDDPFAPPHLAGAALHGVAQRVSGELALTDEQIAERRRDTLSEADIAARFAEDELVGRWLFARGGGWMRWAGCRWARCEDDSEVLELARRHMVRRCEQVTSATLGNAAAERRAPNPAEKQVVAFMASQLSASKLAGVVRLARGLVGASLADFDADPDLLACSNGVVDLRTGQLMEHDPARLVTKVAGIDYSPDARHDDWQQALLALPTDVAAWLQVRLGQAATGHTPNDDVVPVLQGGGENGKSTVMSAVMKALGQHAILLSDRVVLADKSAHPTERMELRGARLAVLEELPGGHELKVDKLKKITGTPYIEARYIAQNSVTFRATHSLVITSNYRPLVRETDHGTWRRLALVRFPYRFRKPHDALEGPDDRHGDPGLRDRLLADSLALAAVLAWVVAGAVAWHAHGRRLPPPPRSVGVDTDAWRRDVDLVMAFVEERLDVRHNGLVLSSELYSAFAEWAEERGHRPWSQRTFAENLAAHPIAATHGISAARTRQTDGLSRLPSVVVTGTPVGPQRVVRGVAFREVP